MKMTAKLKVIGFCLTLALLQSVTFAQERARTTSEVLTNEKVLAMVRGGLEPSIIVNKINASRTSFNTETDELIRLQQARVPVDVINAMVESSADRSSVATAYNHNVSEPVGVGSANEIGIYVKAGEEWKEVLPEVINWKTGGVLKGIASLGVIRGDINGHLVGGESGTRVGALREFLIIVPEGVAITEYQLLKLNKHKKSREFRTVTGGIFHMKGGAAPDLIQYEGEKIAKRTFLVKLEDLSSGEYGFLPPGALISGSAGSQLGKIYTFGVSTTQR